MTWFYCKGCLKKQQRINELEEEVRLLKSRLHRQERTIKEGVFGSSTPSSKIPVKENADSDDKARRGGAKEGHKGHGRRSFSQEEVNCFEDVIAPEVCSDCGEILESKGVREREVLDCRPVEIKKIIYRIERKRCPRCGKTVQGRPAGVLPKSKYGNGLLAHVAVEHCQHGVTLGRLEEQTGVGIGSIVDALHQLSRRFKGVSDKIVKLYRKESVKHADETGWRNDGENGYGWLFCTKRTSVFRFRKTRSSAVVREVLGEKKLPGVLVVDRYGGYNRAQCKIQYCYAHLLREVEDLEKNFPENKEVMNFAERFKPLLSSAISLRGLKLTKREFRLQAARIKRDIISAVNHSASHPGIQRIQDIFREKVERLYHWARDPTIPADNNLAERELRPLVISRKMSFGSQSEEGAKTREILMTVIRTLKKRTSDPYAALKECLDKLVGTPDADLFELLFGHHTNSPRH